MPDNKKWEDLINKDTAREQYLNSQPPRLMNNSNDYDNNPDTSRSIDLPGGNAYGDNRPTRTLTIQPGADPKGVEGIPNMDKDTETSLTRDNSGRENTFTNYYDQSITTNDTGSTGDSDKDR